MPLIPLSSISECRNAKWIYNEDGESGRLEFWNENGYEANTNCFFRIEIPETIGRTLGRRKVKIYFEGFDFGPGYDYDISLSSNDPEMIILGDRHPKRGKCFFSIRVKICLLH